MILYTIGFTQKSAKDFFSIIKKENINLLIDIRLNNSSQLAGFSKGNDLNFFLEKICNISYEHDLIFAPTKEILDSYKKKKISWEVYEKLYRSLLTERKAAEYFLKKYSKYEKICFLCSEPKPDSCHRRLLVETIKESMPTTTILHL